MVLTASLYAVRYIHVDIDKQPYFAYLVESVYTVSRKKLAPSPKSITQQQV